MYYTDNLHHSSGALRSMWMGVIGGCGLSAEAFHCFMTRGEDYLYNVHACTYPPPVSPTELAIRPSLQTVLIPSHVGKSQGPSSSSLSSAAQGGGGGATHNASSSSGSASKPGASEPSSSHSVNN